mmetsp:Transcript_8636/g.15608  ORF Transcript_8636/g.15608 Transcript_8636/m.15608 type:complete len:119 (+) Transcript_8636:43-399(+)
MSGGNDVSAKEWENIVSAQRLHVRNHENELESIFAEVRKVKDIATTMNSELDEQSALLDDIESGIDRSAIGVRNARIDAEVAKETRPKLGIRTFCALLWPGVLCVVLLLWFLGFFGHR